MLNQPRQQQFLDVVDRDEATQRFQSALQLKPLGTETVPLIEAAGRVLGTNIASAVDVTAFDRSNVDGFAVVAADTVGATEETPITLVLSGLRLTPGVALAHTVEEGNAISIATGSVVPRGANAVVMVEDTDVAEGRLVITRAVAPGANISFAGTDIASGETILRARQRLTSREIGMLAATGRAEVEVFRRPRVAVVSTGNEIVAPGESLPDGCVYDSNQAILSTAINEIGGEAIPLGVVRDDEQQLRDAIAAGADCDIVLLSGGTSKGEGDLCYRVVSELANPGIVAHGVALKPGKPVCLAVEDGRPIVVLPGFPTSAVFTFHEFVAPVIRAFAGVSEPQRAVTEARLARQVNSVRGRTEFLLVHLIPAANHLNGSELLAGGTEDAKSDARLPADSARPQPHELVAYPMGKGSGSVTAFSMADGFIRIEQNTEIVERDARVEVNLLSQTLKPADLVFIGSHCRGVDRLLTELQQQGFSTKALFVGSTAGVDAAKRGECDVAGIHLLDPDTEQYNTPWLDERIELVPGYPREQGFVFRIDDTRFAVDRALEQNLEAALADRSCAMVNRNRGSGTRVIIDQLLGSARPRGFGVETRSHNAVCAAVKQGRADWGIAIRPVSVDYGLGFVPVRDEQYDFVVPVQRQRRPALRAFVELLRSGG